MRRLWLLLLAVLALLGAGLSPARADELRPGYVELTQKTAQDWTLVWKAPILGSMAGAQPLLPDGCTVTLAQPRLSGAAILATGTVRCRQSLDNQRVGLKNLPAGATDTILRIAPLGRPVQTERLTPAQPSAVVSAVPDRWQVARSYFLIGVEHILTGYDHLLFVVALALLLQRGWPVLAAATAFTLAHSLTLVGTTLGLFGLPQAPVEATIALSIMFLAVEIVKAAPGRPRLSERVPWAVAFLFGLLHGFGFAGALREVGLPQGDLPAALLAFNLGVEAGQVLIIAATLLALTFVRRTRAAALQPAVRAAAYGIGITASVWFIERIWA